MWSFEHDETTTAGREAVWNLWSDVSGWPEWDEGIEEVSLDGDFAVGATGKLKPTGGPRFPFEITAIDEGRVFTDVTKLPLAKLTFHHELRETPEAVVIHQRITIDGPLTPLWRRVIGKGLEKDVPDTMRSLAAAAEAA
jgi:ligand-binding SRPBCC domain-containing protein